MVTIKRSHGGPVNDQRIVRGSQPQLEDDTQAMVQNLPPDTEEYVVLLLRKGGKVDAKTSKRIESTVKPLFENWGRDHLRLCHDHPGFVEDSDEDDTVFARFTTLNDPESAPVVEDVKPALSRSSYRSSRASNGNVGLNDIREPFRVDDEGKVIACLEACIAALHQQTLKWIAKAWIKGICPKKQAKFPYRDVRGVKAGKELMIPGWWPALDSCGFREPDHIDQGQRKRLLLHLLRLRPSPERLRLWNREAEGVRKTPEEGDWTAWLRQMAPQSVVDDAGTPSPERVHRRQYTLDKLYEIASLEEDFVMGKRDGSTMVSPLRELATPVSRKRVKSRSTKAKRAPPAPASVAEDTSVVKRLSVVKRGRCGSVSLAEDTGSSNDDLPSRKRGKPRARLDALAAQLPAASLDEKPAVKISTVVPFSRPTDVATQAASTPDTETVMLTPMPSSTTTSFGSMISDASSQGVAEYDNVPEIFRQRVFHKREPRAQAAIQVQNVFDIPEPQFDTVPNTPIMDGMMHFEPTLQHDISQGGQPLPLGMPMGYAPMAVAHKPSFANNMPNGLPAQEAPNAVEFYPQAQHNTHGLPSGQTVPHDFHQWQDIGLCGPMYPTEYALFDAPQTFYPEPTFQSGWTMPYRHHPQGPPEDETYGHNGQFVNHEHPPASNLPSSVVRGFTGHASGVGDSASPPGFGQYTHTT